MANNKKSGSGEGLAWVILVLCIAFVGLVIYRIQNVAGGEKFLQWNSQEDAKHDLFSTTAATEASEEESISATEETEETQEQEPDPEGSEPAKGGFSVNDPLLLLVNRDNPAPTEKPQLTRVKEYGATVAVDAADALLAMLSDGKNLGLRFVVCSSYRSTELQHQLFEEDLNARMNKGMSYEEAYAATAAYTMPPGYSEHCTGLAVDIVSYYHQQLDEAQEDTAETRWLQSHCWEYGFILRYPSDKSSVTGIAYESWHYRYVGKEAAKFLTENNLTLEEYHAKYS